MIISRKEFHLRYRSGGFKIIKEVEELMSVDRLFKEIQADAPFRNHEFMFDKKTDFKKLETQEKDEGIIKKYPKIKTEHQRLKAIEKEIVEDSYESVPVSCDDDYPNVIYVENGFHRVYNAHKLGHKIIRVKRRYGKFILSKSITFEDIINLLGMLAELFKGIPTIKGLKKYLENVNSKLIKKGKNYSIGYGSHKDLR